MHEMQERRLIQVLRKKAEEERKKQGLAPMKIEVTFSSLVIQGYAIEGRS